MNIEIESKYISRLESGVVLQMEFGSRLFGNNDENSDYDIVKVYDYELVFGDNKTFLPNKHSFKYSVIQDNIKYDIIYVTFDQFYNSLFNGDGTIMADCFLFSWRPQNAFNYCKTYKVIKGYLGTAKRDLTLHGNDEKILKRSARNLFIAKELLESQSLDLKEVKEFVQDFRLTGNDRYYLLEMEKELRERLQDMFNDNEIENYYIEDTGDELLNLMIGFNNIKSKKF